ncbi:MAG: glycoside hydrolase family 3 C-terminal domain-containing protein [Clostridia bacterium]|nr:glycoside hydrolase family 3 C-terminal domain-containing protein [Clostridia bacterium]
MRTLAKVFRGLTAVFGVLICVCITLGVVMEKYSVSLDSNLGTTSTKIVTDDVSEEDWIYKSEFQNAETAYNTLYKWGIQSTDESIVLLKNKEETDGSTALPLDTSTGSTETKVTLLGLRAYAPIYGNNMGSIPDVAAAEDNQIYDAFEAEGLSVNPEMKSAYMKYLDDIGGWAQASGFAGASPAYLSLQDTDRVFELTTTELQNNNSSWDTKNSDYSTAIVVVGRPGGESDEYRAGAAGYSKDASSNEKSSSGNILGLSQDEKNIISYAKSNFSKTIVLINNTQQMEIQELVDDDGVDAILWIGYPGAVGFHSVAKVLKGEVNPSGHLGDTYAVNTAVNPAMMNFGDDTPWQDTDGLDDVVGNSYLIQAEGIYTGYRYYETRYYDSIMNSDSNAKNAAAGQWVDSNGAAGTADGTWDYDNEVTYTFGYGLSYTTFTQEIEKVTIDGKEVTSSNNAFIAGESGVDLTSDVEVTVKVTNTGSVAGKSVVELYAQAPYTSYDKTNLVEKSAIQLLDYEKTGTLAPSGETGDSQEITMHVDLRNLASYDYTKAKTYVMDYGDYYFALGTDAHDALNNVLAAQGKTTQDGMTKDGDSSLAVKWTYKNESGNVPTGTSTSDVDCTTFSTSETGYTITNQLTDGQYAMDFNAFKSGTVTYLSRSDWKGTYPKTYSGLSANNTSDLLKQQLSDDFYELSTTDDTSQYVWGSTETKYSIYEFAGADWDDERWDDLIDQIGFDEFLDFSAYAFHQIYPISSIGYAGNTTDDGPNGSDGHYLSEGSYEGEAWTDTNTKNPNSSNGYTYGDYSTRFVPSSTNLAYTWNKELNYRNGELVLGESALSLGMYLMIGPACNLHRTAYNGRGAEYYSEDPILSGMTASATVQGAQDKGVLVNLKHYAFNDQEINRSGVCAFMSEQKAREMELRNFEIAIVGTGKPASFYSESTAASVVAEYNIQDYSYGYNEMCNGIMTSYNKIGATASSANYAVMMTILRDEWGFKGYNVTDFTSVAPIAAPKESLLAGTCCFCGFGNSGTTYWSANNLSKDANICAAVKMDIKYALYSMVNSAIMNGTNSTTHAVKLWSSWRVAYTAAEAVVGTLLGLSAVAYVVFEVLAAKKKEG